MSEQREKERCIKERCTAIVLAAGSGKRMGTSVKKQYLLLNGKPVLYYALKAFEDSERIQRIVLVTGEGEESYCKEEIVEAYGFQKVSAIVAGGKERYHSVWNGLNAMAESNRSERGSESGTGSLRGAVSVAETEGEEYIFIHDGARPFVDQATIERAYQEVRKSKACVVGVPTKDTVKIADDNGFVAETPERKYVWQIQTPQVFEKQLVWEAYARLIEWERTGKLTMQVTDDAMVVESVMGHPVKLVMGSYENIKLTTPEDLETGEVFARRICEKI